MLYFDNIGFTWETVANGATTINFEADELGTSYPMTNGNQAIVEEDPDGKSGKVLHVGTSESFCITAEMNARNFPGNTAQDFRFSAFRQKTHCRSTYVFRVPAVFMQCKSAFRVPYKARDPIRLYHLNLS